MTKKQATSPEHRSDEGGVFSKLLEFRDYLELSRIELRKVTWPSIKETRATSLAVLVFVIVMAVFLGVVDLGLSKLIGLVLK